MKIYPEGFERAIYRLNYFSVLVEANSSEERNKNTCMRDPTFPEVKLFDKIC